ncbi:hypothetical protein [Pusillimonas sp. NJUB218]|uniref:hypothetical protein n=1 Tax=Pusillimonas sp. NJUB218 TaxID=2023230 RepID=UPI000F4CAC37|nr:hypothetical protein [Pusillimonas sp. NJUB218]ROT45130.1 hypothetical protein CHR62_09820 [Pusillimonas sp. NJUB218]
MKMSSVWRGSAAALALAGLLVTAPASAQVPDFVQNGPGAGQGKGPGNGQGRGGPNMQGTPGQGPGSGPKYGNGPGNGMSQGGGRQMGPGPRGGADLSIRFSFNDDQRRYAHDYFQDMYRAGNCPPGLAKKNNGCMPPGQAKQWRRGYPLGADIMFYELDGPLLARIGPPPAGHRYVRVASDILMLAVGTNMVVDAIENLGQ